MTRSILLLGRGAVGLLAALVLMSLAGAADDAGKSVVAKSATEAASMIRHEAPGKAWQLVPGKADLSSGETLIGENGATLVSKDGAVRLTFLGNLAGTGRFPVVESVIKLHAAKDADLDFTLDRGHVSLTNLKAKGAARARVHIGDRAGEVILNEPGSQVDLEIFGRWVPGTRFNKEPKPGEGPTTGFVVLARKGDVTIKARGREFAMHGPPGPAIMEGENIEDQDAHPQFLKDVPEWATEGANNERAQKIKSAVEKFRKTAAQKSVSDAAAELTRSSDETERRVGVNILAATDDLTRLALALSESRYPDVWDSGVLALRHWIGRGPGQDQKLYKRLIDEAKFQPGEAEIVVNLLHSFSDADKARPETYEALIDYLESDRLPIRALALWHLNRLVPGGKAIGYSPLAPKDVQEKAIKEWRKLVPAGKVPSKAKKTGNP
jgi:hypothetical protein